MKSFLSVFPAILFVVTVAGCASTRTAQGQYADSEKYVANRRYDKAIAVIEKAKKKEYAEKDRVLYWLDVGMLYHYDLRHRESNEVLTQAEYAIEELYTKSVSKAMASGLLNDNALDYFGEDYEDIYLNVFKALNYLNMDDFDSAFVEIRRIDVKLNLLEDKYRKLVEDYNASAESETRMVVGENRFHNSALARYLSLLMYRADGNLDSARIDRKKIGEAFRDQPQLYAFPVPELPVIRVPEGKAALNFIAFSGFGPNKLADTLYLQGGNGVVLVVTDEQQDDYVTNELGVTAFPFIGVNSGFHMKMQFPRMVLRGEPCDAIEVWMDGERIADLGLLENMELVAREIFEIRLPIIVSKTVIRAVSKGIAKEVGKDVANEALSEELGVGGALLGLVLGVVADVAVDASENADLRISHFFPAYAHVGELILDPGIYDFEVRFIRNGQIIWSEEYKDYEVQADRLNLVESFHLE